MRADPVETAPRSISLSPKIVAEVRGLHDRTTDLSRDGVGIHRLRSRRERREARDAENDLLRVLGFENYEQFVAVAGVVDVTSVERQERANFESEQPERALDADETEAALLRVLRRASRDEAMGGETEGRDEQVDASAASASEFEELHRRVAAFEEELADARFMLFEMRDALRGRGRRSEIRPDDGSTGEIEGAAAAGLAAAAAELRSLCELLREERAELASLGTRARAEAEALLDQARVDAQRERDEAAAAARDLLDRAQAEAVALTRNAISTVDGLRRLAAENPSDGAHAD